MKIYGDQPHLPVDSSRQPGGVGPRSRPTERPQEPGTPQDQVDLSPKARELQQAAQASAQSPEVREAKVAALKEAVEKGTYHVDSEQIAGKMLTQTLLDVLA